MQMIYSIIDSVAVKHNLPGLGTLTELRLKKEFFSKCMSNVFVCDVILIKH